MAGSGGIGQLFKGVIMGIVLILAIIGTMTMLEKKDDGISDSGSIKNNLNPSITQTEPSAPEIQAPEITIPSQTNPQEADQQTNQEASQQTTEPETTETTTKSQKDSFKPVLEGEKTAEEIKKEEDAKKFGQLSLSSINPNNKEKLNVDFVVFDSKNKKVAESNNVNSTSYKLPVGNYRVVTTLNQNANESTRKSEPVQKTQNITITADKTSTEVFELEPPSTIGILQVSAINASNQKTLKANFLVQKENGETVASRKGVTQSLFKLKAGSYKVTVTSGTNTDFRTIVVEPGDSASEIFKLKDVTLQGKVVVRVYDMNSNKPVAADITISASSGKKVQALKAVSQTEISLSEGRYTIKVAGANGQSTKSINVVAGKRVNEVFRIDAPSSNNGSINGVQINDNVRISGVNTNKSEDRNQQEAQNKTDKQTTEKIFPVPVTTTPTPTTMSDSTLDEAAFGSLKLFSRNAADQRPLKSNFYVQTPNGKNIAKKIYTNTANFKLKPGAYKVTIRSKNRQNIVANIQIIANQAISRSFQLEKKTSPQQNNQNQTTQTTTNNKRPTVAPVLAPAKPAINTKAIPNGFLNVAMQPARNTHFIISDRRGKKIVELTSVPSGNFKLDTGVYVVTAIFNNQQRKKTIQVHQGKTTRLNFTLSDFQIASPQPRKNNNANTKGVLRSRIVDNAGRPLRGNLTVTNQRGQVVARANNVTVGTFNLAPTPHTIIVNYSGLSGSEKVNITAGKTTVQTFTISPTNKRPANNRAQPAPSKSQPDPRDVLRDKVEEELRRIF